MATCHRNDVGQGCGFEIATHVFADVVPHGKQDALAFVVAGTVGVRLTEISGDDWAVNCADDVGQTDFLRSASQDVTAADAAL